MEYDISGNKPKMNDPDMGTWTYSYNALGKLISQTDAKGQTSTMTYDKLGRMTQRTEAEGSSSWTYDTKSNGSDGFLMS
jgi:YD repeat-containing protein